MTAISFSDVKSGDISQVSTPSDLSEAFLKAFDSTILRSILFVFIEV